MGRFRPGPIYTTGAIIALVAVAVVWAVVGQLNAPRWLQAIAAGLAAAGTAGGTYIIKQLQGREDADKQRESTLATHLRFWQPPDGRIYPVEQVDPYKLRITPSKLARDAAGLDQPPYVPRDRDRELDEALRSRSFVLVLGESKAGKSRSAFEAARRVRPKCPLIVPEAKESLQRILAVEPPVPLANAVVWLDDLEIYLGSEGEGLTTKVLETLDAPRPPATVLATMRTTEFDKYGPTTRVARTIAEVLERAETIRLDTALTPKELAAARQSYPRANPNFLSGLEQVGIGPYLVAGPELLRRLENQQGEVGWAIVRVAVDWRRAGLTRAVPENVIKRLYPTYLRPGRELSDGSYLEGLAWAREQIYQVALLYLDEPGPPPTYRAFDYIVDQITLQAPPIPSETWDLVLKGASVEEGFAIGVAASALDATAVAERAFARAAGAGNRDAANNLGVLLEDRGDMKGAAEWYRRAASQGAPFAAYNLAVVLADRGDRVEAEKWYRQAAAEGDEDAANNLGVILDERGEATEAEQWYRRAAEAGQVLAEHNLAEVYEGKGDMRQAETWYRKAAEDGEADDAFTVAGILEERGEVTETEKWLRVAANAGLPDAMNDLAVLLDNAKNLTEAEGWWQKAVDAGQPQAAYNLGVLLEDRGDVQGAMRWYRRAATLGDPDAQDRLDDELIGRRGDRDDARRL